MDLNMNKVLCEFLGTFVFLFTILQSGKYAIANGPGLSTFVVAMGLFVALAMFGAFSGGHLNPAVSTMMWFANDGNVNTLPHLGSYIGAQVLGGLAAYATWKKLQNYL